MHEASLQLPEVQLDIVNLVQNKLPNIQVPTPRLIIDYQEIPPCYSAR